MKRKYNQLTGFEKEKLKEDLNSAPNIEMFLSILMSRFDLRNCKPGLITHRTLSSQMVNTVLPMLNPHEK